MLLDVALTPALVPDLASGPPDDGLAVVVIDTLRFTSTVISALAAGADGILPVAEEDAARSRAAELGALLGGERDALPLPGFDLGNSPPSYDQSTVAGRLIVMTTTNGTRAVGATAEAGRVLAGCLLNAEVTADELTAADPERVLLLCAGRRGAVAADDLATAGCLAGSLLLMAAAEPTDAARTAIALFDAWKGDLLGLLNRSASGRKLASLGLVADIEFCARVDAVPLVAELDDAGIFRGRSEP